MAFVAVIGVISCKGDPTSGLRNGVDHLLASPLQLFVDEGAAKNVVVTAVDLPGNLVGTRFTLGTIGAGISVVADDSFNLVYDNNGNLVRPGTPTRVRYIVTGTANTADTYFKVSAGGKSDSIAVRVLPVNLPSPPLSATTPAPGDTLSLALAAPYRFTDSSTVTIVFPGDTVSGVITGLAADSRTLSFIPPPGVSGGTVTVDNVVLDYAQQAETFTITAAGVLTTTSGLPATPSSGPGTTR
ncbi:MAG TPA: hypothetical protein VNH46_06945 [Gemmatimonadales bacterium]|nr:hypothetical protein [Gemmatimonadales bacterium]